MIDVGFATILAAIITAIAAVVVAVLQRQKRKVVEGELATARQKLHDALVNKYGLEIKKVIAKAEIQDLNGNQRIVYEWQGVKAKDGHEFEGIPFVCSAAAPNARIGQPTLSYNFSRALYMDLTRQDDHHLGCLVKVPGRLSAGEELSYSVNVSVSEGCLITREDVSKAYKGDPVPYEYHRFDVSFPTAELEIEVVFPKNYHATSFVLVCYTGTETIHRGENQRLLRYLNPSEGRVTLNVDYPLPAFSYGIYWESPSQDSLPRNP